MTVVGKIKIIVLDKSSALVLDLRHYAVLKEPKQISNVTLVLLQLPRNEAKHLPFLSGAL